MDEALKQAQAAKEEGAGAAPSKDGDEKSDSPAKAKDKKSE